MTFFKYVEQFDYLSTEAKLTLNYQGKVQMKTFLGGIISLISIFFSIGLSIYFFIQFLTKNNKTLISSREYSHFVNLTGSHQLPFLFRLSDLDNKPYKNPEKIYTIGLKYWYRGKAELLKIDEQENKDIKIEKCDINKHFGEYKELFTNLSDLNTFFCPILREDNETIYGLYGSSKPFSYYQFYIHKCMNDSSNNNGCEKINIIDSILSNTYLDIRTVDYSINSLNSNNVKKATVRADRHMISSTAVYKRIWMYLDWIEYVTDNGLFFENDNIEYFHQVNSMRYDVDLLDYNLSMLPGTFLSVTILSTGQVIKYNRHFLKLQEYLANVGGITKFINAIAFFLNYYISQNLYYLKLINGFVFDQYRISPEKSRIIGQINKKLSTSSLNKSFKKRMTILNEELSKNAKSKDKGKEVAQKIKIKWFKLILPFTFPNNTKKNVRDKYYLINKYLNVFDLMKTIELSQFMLKNLDDFGVQKTLCFRGMQIINDEQEKDTKYIYKNSSKKNYSSFADSNNNKQGKGKYMYNSESNENIVNSIIQDEKY